MDLTIEVTDVHAPGSTHALPLAPAHPLLICNRCESTDEIVVAIIEIPEIGVTWALCGACKREVPRGFHVA